MAPLFTCALKGTRKQRQRRCTGKGGYSLSRKRIAPFKSPKRKVSIGSLRLEQPLCLRNANACARRCRVSAAIRFASAPTPRCRSAHLAEVQPNFRLLQVCTALLLPAKAALLRSPCFKHEKRPPQRSFSCSFKSSNAARTAATTKAEKVQSLPRIAASISSSISLGKRTDLFVVGGTLGILKAIVLTCNTFYMTSVLQSCRNMRNINVLHLHRNRRLCYGIRKNVPFALQRYH